MKKLIEQPHILFLISVPIFILFGILSGNDVLDINVHDTYYVIAYNQLANLSAFIFGILGIVYWILLKSRIRLFKGLNFTHILLTFGSLLFAYIYSLISFSESEFPLFDETSKVLVIQTIALILVTLGQLIFLINVIIGLFRKRKTTSG
jgi:cytochrome c oxidase subunit 1